MHILEEHFVFGFHFSWQACSLIMLGFLHFPPKYLLRITPSDRKLV